LLKYCNITAVKYDCFYLLKIMISLSFSANKKAVSFNGSQRYDKFYI